MRSLMCIAALLLAPTAAAAEDTIFADRVIQYYDSGRGPLQGPYGGTISPRAYPRGVPLSYATDRSDNTFVSLPTGSSLTLGFTSGVVFDGPGNDIFVSEVGAAAEVAEIYVSSDFGQSFTLLGRAFGDQLTELDLRDIGFRGQVNAVRIVGLDSKGDSPGFDVQFVQGLKGSVLSND